MGSGGGAGGVTAYTPQSHTIAPPTHVLHFLCTVLQAINIWTDVSALPREPFHTPSQPWSQWNETITHTSHIILSGPDTSPAYQGHITSCSWVLRDTAAPPPTPPPIAYARFQSILWYLCASPETFKSITDTQRLRIHCFFLHHHHGKSTIGHTHPHRDTLYKTYTRGMHKALDAKDLGRWTKLLQARVAYLPYKTHPIIRLLRTTSRTQTWHTSMPPPPPTILIYVAMHTFLMVCYPGKTTLASTRRLRNHVTTARARSEDSTFHDMRNQTTELQWTLVSVEVVDSEELGCYRERSWWRTIQNWCLNDTTPALPSTRTTIPGA